MSNPQSPRESAAENNSIGIIILAAGAARRMNAPKQLLKFQGRTLLRRAVETALESIYEPIIVVLGANFEKVRAEIEDLPVAIVFNADWQDGLSSSLKTGIENLLKLSPEAAAVVVALADQPFVTAKHLNLFAEKFLQSKNPLIAALYHETVGVPALFAREVLADFDALSGDKGAKPIIEKHRASLLTIDLPEAAFDIDTPFDLGLLKSDFGL
jgi:molybdenum cofactor cytidylyltransferase